MKNLVLVAALAAGFSLTANAHEYSDVLDAQYELSWAEETVFEEFNSTGIIDPLAAYDGEGAAIEFSGETHASGPVVDIAAMEIVSEPVNHEDGVLFVETYD